jgi:hypothetical protein
MEEPVRAEDLLRLLLLANGPVTVDRDKLAEAVEDRQRYSVGLTEDPENGEYTFHLIGHDERPNPN